MTEKPKISVVLPIMIGHGWQSIMTDACIETMYATTEVPFELVVVETGSKHFEHYDCPAPERHTEIKYHHAPAKTSYTKDFNKGVSIATGDYIVHIGNDIFTKPGWLEAMLDCFEIGDCGIATLGATDMKHEQQNLIREGVYGPLCMFKRHDNLEYLDTANFDDIFSDTDLVMRYYGAGMKSYRNWNVVITHAYQQTYDGLHSKEERHAKFLLGLETFKKKHSGSPLLMYKILTEGVPV